MQASASLPASVAPAPLRPGQVLLLACASGLCVANVYFAQPLLDALARDFGIARADVGMVVSATQAGCALALLLLVPWGDRADRRRLLTAQLLALAAALALVAGARSALPLLAGMLAVGMLGTAMTQGLIAYAATAAAPAEQGRVVGAAQGGVVVGLLLARVYSGAISELAGWRAVYVCAAGLMLLLAWPLWRRLPALPPPARPLPYRRLLGSMLTLLRDEPVLRVRGMLALLLFASFNVFWSALVLPLSAPPYEYGHAAIGAFGLVGAAGALAAARAGHWSDRGRAQQASALALALLLLAWWPLAHWQASLWPLVVGILLLDLGGQALHVTNQSLILRARPDAAGRLIGVYMLFYAVGSGLGGYGATRAYAYGGWAAVCALGAALSLLALLFWALTLPRAHPARR
ncbi:MFS transporter [Bordetella genomosp. 1]|uniref:MFS transporter n=1 Tax=Bordetella genomosp. 1 TaxID=1395607 RepID=A0A261SPL7_9BORD|nr:MFS transporter [Bordetella genomosp. 1]OZI39344.1 MFS transporter [Bordetella genomosp. 1]